MRRLRSSPVRRLCGPLRLRGPWLRSKVRRLWLRRLVARLRWLRERRLRWRLLAVDVGPRLGLGVLLTEPRHLMGCGSLPEALSATSTSRRDLVWSASTDRLQIVCRRCARPSE
jgi:hypothetical protein